MVNKTCENNREKIYCPRFTRRCVNDILLVKQVNFDGTYDTGGGTLKYGDFPVFGGFGIIITLGIPRKSATNTAHKAEPSYTIKSKFLRS